MTLSREERALLTRSGYAPAPFRQGEPATFSRKVLAETRRSTRDTSSQAAARPRERMRWSIVPIAEIVGRMWRMWVSEILGRMWRMWVSEILNLVSRQAVPRQPSSDSRRRRSSVATSAAYRSKR